MLEFVIISFILMTLMFDSGMILLEEVRSLSLLTWTCYFYSSAFVAEIFWLIFFFLPQNKIAWLQFSLSSKRYKWNSLPCIGYLSIDSWNKFLNLLTLSCLPFLSFWFTVYMKLETRFALVIFHQSDPGFSGCLRFTIEFFIF